MPEDKPKDILSDVEYWPAGSGKTHQLRTEPATPLIVGKAKPEDPRELAQHIADASKKFGSYQLMAGQTNFVDDGIEQWFATAIDTLRNAPGGHGGAIDDLERARDMMILVHHSSGVANEAGEVAGKVKKLIRDKQGYITFGDIDDIVKEMGDVLWYIAALCTALNVDMSEVAKGNLTKLFSRKERGVLGGSGDNR